MHCSSKQLDLWRSREDRLSSLRSKRDIAKDVILSDPRQRHNNHLFTRITSASGHKRTITSVK